jgi:hypothetical protein
MAGEDAERVDLLASVGPLDATVALLREFLHRSGALRAVALVDAGPAEGAAIVDCARLAPIEVTTGGRTVHLPHSIELDVEPPAVPDVRRLPPFDVDLQAGAVTGTIGGVRHLADAVRALARLLGGRNVAMIQFETTTPGLPFTISARGEETIVLAIGDDQYELPDD